MKKRFFTVLVLSVSITIGVFAQKTQRLTFMEQKPGGTYGGTVTVNAFLLGWQQQQAFIENGMLVQHVSSKLIDGEWSPWELLGREPSPVPTIRLMYDIVIQEYNRNPRAATIFNYYGQQIVKKLATPNNKSSPFWWNDDGRSFFNFYELWVIVP